MSKIIYEFSVGKYAVLQIDTFPAVPYSKVKIKDKLYTLIPAYDLPDCIAIESNEKFINSEVEFVI